MLLLTTGVVTITRIGPDHQITTVVTNGRANLQGNSQGAPIAPPWYQPSMDSELGGAQFADWSLMLDGDDLLPGYNPRPGDTIIYTSNNGALSRNGTYRIVAAPLGEELLEYRDLPVCKTKDAA